MSRRRFSIFAESSHPREIDINGSPRSGSPVAASAAAVGQPQRLIPPKPRSRWTPASGKATPCQCRVRGTIETSRPLSKSMKVTMWIEDAPESQATVELFMGSPRGFQLGPVSCGEHRILFSPESKQQYRLEPGGDRIDCRGGVHHVRMVLIEDSNIR